MLEFFKSKWWDEYCDWCYRLINDWVDNLISKEYKGNSVEILEYIYIKFGNYKYISYILSLQYETVTITIFIKNDINFLKLDLSLIYRVYIHVVFFFHVYTL